VCVCVRARKLLFPADVGCCPLPGGSSPACSSLWMPVGPPFIRCTRTTLPLMCMRTLHTHAAHIQHPHAHAHPYTHSTPETRRYAERVWSHCSSSQHPVHQHAPRSWSVGHQHRTIQLQGRMRPDPGLHAPRPKAACTQIQGCVCLSTGPHVPRSRAARTQI